MFQFFTKKTETLHFSLPSLINMCIVAWQNDFFRKKLNMSSLLHFMKQIFFNLKEWGRRRVQTKVTCFFCKQRSEHFFLKPYTRAGLRGAVAFREACMGSALGIVSRSST